MQENKIEYTNAMDTSGLVQYYYTKQKAFKLESYILDIEDWLSQSINNKIDNTPLIIKSQQSQLSYNLIAQWMQYHQKNDKKKIKDIIITHYARTSEKNANIYYAIYKILVLLREITQIDQKVELIEQKLRKYFGYWLDTCSSFLDEQIVNNQNIIIVIDGIDFLKDIYLKKEAITAFWFPFPISPRIRFILTSYGKNNSAEYFQKLNCKQINLMDNQEAIQIEIQNYVNQKQSYLTKQTFSKFYNILMNLPQSLRGQQDFVRVFFQVFMPYKSAVFDANLVDFKMKDEDVEAIQLKHDFQAIQKIDSIDSLFLYILQFYSQHICKLDKIKKFFMTLVIIQKRLKTKVIQEISQLNNQEFNTIIFYFKGIIIAYESMWFIINEKMKNAIRVFFQPDSNYIKKLHEQISQVLENQPLTFTNLEEQVYHLNQSQQYFKLKENMSNTENFLLLYNGNFKYDFCRYWQKLEEKGFDPVIEYNKSIEMFENHYKVKTDQLFLIIMQVSRFLKDFSDFETKNTPDFRHPPIKGGCELEQIGLLGELKKLKMTFDDDPEQEVQILKDVEKLNIEIPTNKEIVREYYKDIIRKNMVKQDPLDENEEAEKLMTDLQNDNKNDTNEEDNVQRQVVPSRSLVNNNAKKKDKKYLEGIQLMPEPEINESEPTYYYYKVNQAYQRDGYGQSFLGLVSIKNNLAIIQ